MSQLKWSDFDNYTRYTVKDGLATDAVYNLIEDNAGFLWIASSKGVTRFDGSTFVNYEYYDDNGVQKSIGDVLELSIDQKNKYIFITSRSGVLMSPLKTPEFKPINAFYPSIAKVMGNCNSIYIDDGNNLWAGLAGKGLIKIDLDKKDHKFINIQETDTLNKPFEQFYQINAIVPDDQNPKLLWLGTSEGLIAYDQKSDHYEIYQYQNKKDLFQRYINEVYPLNNKVYVGSNGANWYVFEKNSHESYQILKRGSELFHHEITKFFKNDDGTLWISSYFRGLVQYDPLEQKILKGVNNNYRIGKVLGITLRDSRGMIWFADGNGLYKYNPDVSSKHIDLVKNNEFDYPTPILKIIKIENYYYICTDHSMGIYKVNASDLSFSIIPIPETPNTTGYVLRDMLQMDDHRILVLGNQKVYILDTKNNKVTEPPLQIANSLETFLRCVAKDQNNNYWIGSNRDGLYQFNYDNLSFKKYKDEFIGKTSRDYDYFKRLYVDTDNKLWIGQASTSVMDLETDSIYCLNPDFNYENPRPFGDFYEDGDNRMWVANKFDGISFADKSNLKSGLKRVVEGSFDGVYKYNDSIIWTVGEGKLGLLNTNTLNHQNFNLKPNSEFSGPIVAMEDGKFMIGYNNGVLIYDPKKLSTIHEVPQIYIQEVKANNKYWFSGADVHANNFTLQSGTKSLSIKLSALAYQNPEQLSYQYKIDDETWVDLGRNKEINLSNLRQGNYLIAVKVINGMGMETANASFQFTVEPFWYTSNMAILVYFLLLIGLVYAFYKFNLNRKLALAESKRIKEIDDLKSKMFANISHELRTPLTLIKGFAAILIKNNKEEHINQLTHGIESNSDQLLNLVNQMLDLSELDANKMEIHYKNGDIVVFIKKCVALYRSFSQSKLQQLKFHSNVGELHMDFDDDKLQKILNNVLSNAIKYTPENGKISVRLTQKEQLVSIAISDSGKGISENDLPLVFDRYYKTNDLNGNEGSGIGLSLTKELVELLEGTIHVCSEVGKGSTFTITLPIKNSAAVMTANHFEPFVNKASATIDPPKKFEQKTEKSTILLVEDNKDIQQFITTLLSGQYRILLANNGEEGLLKAQKKDIDLIISDVMMPHTDGFEFCQKIKSNVATSHIPFLMLSARTHTQDKQKAYGLGIDGYLTKPFHPEELTSILKNLLIKQKRQQQYLSELLNIKRPSFGKTIVNKLDSQLIGKLQKYILDNPTKMSASDLAKALGVSRTQLHRKIKSLTGKSLTQYANHIKIEKAKHMLRTSDLQVNEIAYATGFESPSYFIRLFKKEVGQTPESFKKQPVSSKMN
ncbi:hybrid sensor histidine kinase/response regulator transcription factor [Allomuricauda sp. NBRC 101325]|uniref:hybrid sensor histidine kinase/response regulator transcription factor n=1 Tax=Allomuricauda sp. NBRC 101325 TaxID=1113758 RepID=UPI0024A5B120|nr:hybrid sensor histidine kinase/response regulator transcription factor [Muricauda sp. NBRC 101325]GLU44028.1 hybrid sensor histidine kinase/response regulator [Muricauda sp. NBRC 101325]